MRASASSEGIAEIPSRAIELFEPPEDAIYTIDATAHLVGVRTFAFGCAFPVAKQMATPSDAQRKI
jgi:hypothetical protein